MFKTTLHNVMRTILLQKPDMPASTSFLVEEIAKRGLYERKDGAAARTREINARARNYTELFEFTEPDIIKLKGNLQTCNNSADFTPLQVADHTWNA